jgi:zinc ribbon protein
MKRLLPRPPRRRANRPQEGTEEAPQTAEAPPTEVQPAVPAGAEPADPVAPRPTFRNRGRLRRRLRFLRRVRELGFRDLGGLVFDQHKFDRQNVELVRGKVAALAAVDAELRVLEEALGEKRDITELREPGITACPRCGTLHGSDANFCPSCGLALTGARTIAADVGEGVHGSGPVAPALPSGSEPGVQEREPEHDRDGREYGRREPDPRDDAPRAGAEQPTAVVRPADRPDA